MGTTGEARMNLETVNKRLTNAERIAHEADLTYFAELVGRVRSFERPGDQLEKLIPSVNAPFAWRTAYELYRTLRARDQTNPAQLGVQISEQQITSEKEWNVYLEHRLEFYRLARIENIDSEACQYLGLRPGDLDDPSVSDHDEIARYGGGRHPDWRGRASRINSALIRFKGMGEAEKAGIPQAMYILSIERKLDKLIARVSFLEQKFLEHQPPCPSQNPSGTPALSTPLASA
jgi:hypothetical protein